MSDTIGSRVHRKRAASGPQAPAGSGDCSSGSPYYSHPDGTIQAKGMGEKSPGNFQIRSLGDYATTVAGEGRDFTPGPEGTNARVPPLLWRTHCAYTRDHNCQCRLRHQGGKKWDRVIGPKFERSPMPLVDAAPGRGSFEPAAELPHHACRCRNHEKKCPPPD